MSEIEKAKLILALMKKAGYEDTCEPEVVDSWTTEEVDYFVVNYDSYLKE